MSDNVRFHSKWHGKSHHTEATPGYYDSSRDPIAGPGEEFQGKFHLSGCVLMIEPYARDVTGSSDGSPISAELCANDWLGLQSSI